MFVRLEQDVSREYNGKDGIVNNRKEVIAKMTQQSFKERWVERREGKRRTE